MVPFSPAAVKKQNDAMATTSSWVHMILKIAVIGNSKRNYDLLNMSVIIFSHSVVAMESHCFAVGQKITMRLMKKIKVQ